MTKPIIRIHNTETNEIIDREMTDIEFAEFETLKQNSLESKAKAALLERLGITEDEAKLLLA
jgi:hypothetical protein